MQHSTAATASSLVRGSCKPDPCPPARLGSMPVFLASGAGRAEGQSIVAGGVLVGTEPDINDSASCASAIPLRRQSAPHCWARALASSYGCSLRVPNEYEEHEEDIASMQKAELPYPGLHRTSF